MKSESSRNGKIFFWANVTMLEATTDMNRSTKIMLETSQQQILEAHNYFSSSHLINKIFFCHIRAHTLRFTGHSVWPTRRQIAPIETASGTQSSRSSWSYGLSDRKTRKLADRQKERPLRMKGVRDWAEMLQKLMSSVPIYKFQFGQSYKARLFSGRKSKRTTHFKLNDCV